MITKQVLSNTEVLLFILGYQGGTIHQLAKELGVKDTTILNADYEIMQGLCRLAQTTKAMRLK